jgi:hypothetical protein
MLQASIIGRFASLSTQAPAGSPTSSHGIHEAAASRPTVKVLPAR